jgi:hypothetical protein
LLATATIFDQTRKSLDTSWVSLPVSKPLCGGAARYKAIDHGGYVMRLRRYAPLLLATCFSLAVGTGVVVILPSAANASTPITKGDLAVSLANDEVDEYTPSGVFVQHLMTSADGLGLPTGSAFDGSGNLYVTDFGNDQILRRDALTGAISVAASSATLGNGHVFDAPESIVFNKGYTQMLISDANRSGPGGGINVVNPATGAGLGFYALPSSSGSDGIGESDWLAFDASSNLYMTNENPSQGVMKVDTSTGDVIQPSFAASLPDVGYGLSLDKNGNVWVGDTSSILEFNPAGTLIQTISNANFSTVFAAIFNPAGDQFYAGDYSTGTVYTYGLDGSLIGSFSAGSGIDGLSVAGSAVPPNPPPNTGSRYVALGDSYSSGEGAIDKDGHPAFDPSTNLPKIDECHRSLNAYPNLLSTEPQVNAIPFGYVFSACSGARVANFVKQLPGGGGWNEGPQLDSISSAKSPSTTTGLVTLSIGGNDVGFVPDLAACIHGFGRGFSGCTDQITERLSQGLRLLTLGGRVKYDFSNFDDWNFCSHCNPGSRDVVNVPSLVQLYAAIHSRAPNARIRVMGYPQLFPNKAKASCVVGTFVNKLGQHLQYRLEPWEMTALYNAETKLNATIKAQVALAKAQGMDISFVDTFASFAGHGPCDSAKASSQWINGLLFKAFLTQGPSEFSIHPNKKGQAQLEQLMLKSL